MRKCLHKSKPKGNILCRAAAVLFCLTLVSTYLVTGLFARYSTSGQSADSARVAKFSISGDEKLSTGIEVKLIPGGSESANLVINNNSEVAVEYTIVVTNVTENLPLSFRMEKPDSSLVSVQSGTPFTAEQLPGSHTDKYVLHIDWTEGDNDPEKWMGMVDYITVTVTATQID